MHDQQRFLNSFLPEEANLRAFVGSLVRDRLAREDLMQDIALTLWEKFIDYNSDYSFGAWARGIAINKVRQYCERSSRQTLSFSPETIQAIADAFTALEQRRPLAGHALNECLLKLPEKSRRILKLRYSESHTVPQIASILGAHEAMIYKALARLRERLRKCVEHWLSLQGG
jgi:RNA polymerase sigma-70 factor, ECF subfamily